MVEEGQRDSHNRKSHARESLVTSISVTDEGDMTRLSRVWGRLLQTGVFAVW
jgi:hypothetical protein